MSAEFADVLTPTMRGVAPAAAKLSEPSRRSKLSASDSRLRNTSAGVPGVSPLVRALLKDAKVTIFGWHCLRHTFASRLVMAGVDIRTVQELLGHKTSAMTVRYCHLAPKHTLAAVERLDAPTEQPTDTTTDTKGLGRVSTEATVLQQVIQ